MPGRQDAPGAGHRGRPHPARRTPSSPGRTVLATSGGPKRTVLASTSGKTAPGYGSTLVEPPPVTGFEAPPVPKPGRRPKKRRSTKQRVLRWAIGFVVFVIVLAGIGYGYVRYRFGQITTQACATCTAVNGGQPFNVLLVGSDSRAGNTGAAASQFGSAQQVTGQRSDTIKILHVDPSNGSARLLSIPRDTFVQMSDVPTSTGLSGDQKINTAFNEGAPSLIATIQNTFGIAITHFVIIDFQGLTNAVNTVGGIYLDFPYPVRDNDNGNNNSGLSIPHAGCQLVNGAQTLALARSRFFQYYANGYWHYDPSSDIGRIERQNVVIDAIIARARGSYNPFTLNAFLGNIVHDITVDQQMSFGDMVSLATTYHAFSPSKLQTFTLPTVPATNRYAGAVEVVEQPQAEQVLTEFLGTAPGSVAPGAGPLDASGSHIQPPAPTTTTTAPPTATTHPSGTSSTATTVPGQSTPSSYDPTICTG